MKEGTRARGMMQGEVKTEWEMLAGPRQRPPGPKLRTLSSGQTWCRKVASGPSGKPGDQK